MVILAQLLTFLFIDSDSSNDFDTIPRKEQGAAAEQPGADTGTHYVPTLVQRIVGTFVLSDSCPVTWICTR